MNLNNNLHCVNCGTRLEQNENQIKYCPNCKVEQYDPYFSAVSMLVLNQAQDKVLIIRHPADDYFRLVAGYVDKFENLEDCLFRELKEETGLVPLRYWYNHSKYFPKSNTLMVNFVVLVDENQNIEFNEEIAEASWVSFDTAQERLSSALTASFFLENYLRNKL